MTLLLALVLAAAPTPEPSYVVERVVTVGGELRRVTLFRDGTGVVKRRSATGEETLRHTPVGELVQAQIEQVVREVYPEIAEFSSMGRGPEGGSAELRLAPPGLAPLTVRISLTAVLSASAARLGATLDALEERVLAGKPPAEDLRTWEPALGERVELDDGTVLTVVTVIDTPAGGQTVQVRQGSSPITVFLDVADLRLRAVRRIREEPR